MNKKKFDLVTALRELCLVVGYLMWGYGMWLIWPPLTFLTCGALLVAIGFSGANNRQKGGD